LSHSARKIQKFFRLARYGPPKHQVPHTAQTGGT
jgi:hypothetical protein